MKKIILLILILPSITYSQNKKKIDSVFTHYFNVVEIELGQRNLMDYPYLIEEIDLGNGEKGYINTYFFDAVYFFEKITTIKAPRIHRGQLLIPDITSEILLKWKNWYTNHSNRISWSKRKSKPKISF
ncbi:MAG: hypothetical protein ACI9Y7_002766 [Dokdonia sp.]|jgi:hypothetical protein